MHTHTQSNHLNTKDVFIWMSVFGVCGVRSVTQSCLTLWDPRGCSLPDSSVHGISQARILEWVAISFSRGSSLPKDQTHVSWFSCIDRWILYNCATWEALFGKFEIPKIEFRTLKARLDSPCQWLCLRVSHTCQSWIKRSRGRKGGVLEKGMFHWPWYR